MQALVEDEMVFNGGDERAAEALVLENGEHWGKDEIMVRLEAAVKDQSKAA